MNREQQRMVDEVTYDEFGGAGLDVRSLVRSFYDSLWNGWDDDAVERVLSKEFRFRGSLGQRTVGRDGWRAYRDQVRAGAPDFRNEVIELVVDGNRAAARLRYTGIHRGLLLGLDGTGRAFAYDGAAFFRARAGQLIEAWVLGDLTGLQRQLTQDE